MIKDLDERIIYENESVLVVNKPYGLPSTGKSLGDDDCLQFYLIKRHGGMVWAIHQLDADTSGVNIFVTDKKLVPIYKKYLETINANKEYLAVVHGVPVWDEHEEFGSIGKIDKSSLGVHPDGKSAHSKFTVIKRGESHTFLKAQIFTGRTHQIRIHLAHLGHPVVGDDWYCKPACEQHIRQALHCQRIDFLASDEAFTASLPRDLEDLLVRFQLTRA